MIDVLDRGRGVRDLNTMRILTVFAACLLFACGGEDEAPAAPVANPGDTWVCTSACPTPEAPSTKRTCLISYAPCESRLEPEKRPAGCDAPSNRPFADPQALPLCG